jgi:DNA invertase Pin-like site-specific DNA recombinase
MNKEDQQDPIKIITYLRVSSELQKKSGLGIEAQRSLCMQHIKTNDANFVAEFVEYESGRKTDFADRPELHRALNLLESIKDCQLLVARTDRLARDLHFIAGLLKRNVQLVVAGHKSMSKLEWHMHAMIAEHEADLISTRTKQALAEAKARGVVLGCPRHKIATAQQLGGHAMKVKAQAFRDKLTPMIKQLIRDPSCHVKGIKNRGKVSNKRIAERLNSMGMTTAKGRPFNENLIYHYMKKEGIRV